MTTLNLLGVTHRIPHIRKKLNPDLVYCHERTDLTNQIFFRFIDFLEDICKFMHMSYKPNNIITKEMAQDWRRLFAFLDLSWKRYEFDTYATDVLGPWDIDELFSDFYGFFADFNEYLWGQWPNKLVIENCDSEEDIKKISYRLNLFAKIFHRLEYSFKKNTIIIKEVDESFLNWSKKNIAEALREEFGENIWLNAFKNVTGEK